MGKKTENAMGKKTDIFRFVFLYHLVKYIHNGMILLFVGWTSAFNRQRDTR
jgi:hypothetical protein